MPKVVVLVQLPRAELGLEFGSPGLEFITFPNIEKEITRRNSRESKTDQKYLQRTSGQLGL